MLYRPEKPVLWEINPYWIVWAACISVPHYRGKQFGASLQGETDWCLVAVEPVGASARRTQFCPHKLLQFYCLARCICIAAGRGVASTSRVYLILLNPEAANWYLFGEAGVH